MARVLKLALACAALALLAPSVATAATIKGTLSKKGLTVVAIAKSGTTHSAIAKTGRFKLTVEKGVYTLQLRGRDGRYAGPVVVAVTRSGRAVLGVKSGARLGKVRVLKGYARPGEQLARRFVSRKFTALAKNGVPIGARRLGLVKTRNARVSGAEPPPAGADTDADGVPNAFDIDDNGNLVLDAVDASQTSEGFRSFSQMFLDIPNTVNANAAAVTDAMIDRTLVEKLELVLLALPSGSELDCGGLSYCSPGGTGRLAGPPEEGGDGDQFPDCCDEDGDGFGTMPLVSRGMSSEFRLRPRATSAQIGSGDTLIEHVATEGGGQTEVPGTINFVFNTTPAIKSWEDGAANHGQISYPAAEGSPGTHSNPLPVAASETGEYTVLFEFWRPQRKPVPGAEPAGDYIDIGRLGYDFNVPPQAATSGGGGNPSPQCPLDSLSTGDPNLELRAFGPGAQAVDLTADQPADVTRTLTVKVSLTRCIAAKGGGVLGPGTTIGMDIGANAVSSTSVDHANQSFVLRTL